jgi:hypothetical protein
VFVFGISSLLSHTHTAGHAHFYETTWPVANGRTTQKSYANISTGVVHVTSGIAGPPEYEQYGAAHDWTRTQLTNATSYSRVTLTEGSLHFEQVGQDDGKVLDSFTLTKAALRHARVRMAE